MVDLGAALADSVMGDTQVYAEGEVTLENGETRGFGEVGLAQAPRAVNLDGLFNFDRVGGDLDLSTLFVDAFGESPGEPVSTNTAQNSISENTATPATMQDQTMW